MEVRSVRLRRVGLGSVRHGLETPETITSLALIPLRVGASTSGNPVFGLLVLASGDAQRFTSGMGTDFLSRIGELASAALSRLR